MTSIHMNIFFFFTVNIYIDRHCRRCENRNNHHRRHRHRHRHHHHQQQQQQPPPIVSAQPVKQLVEITLNPNGSSIIQFTISSDGYRCQYFLFVTTSDMFFFVSH